MEKTVPDARWIFGRQEDLAEDHARRFGGHQRSVHLRGPQPDRGILGKSTGDQSVKATSVRRRHRLPIRDRAEQR